MYKNILLLLFVSLLFFAGCTSSEIQTGEDAINVSLLQKYIFFLASDSLMGRDTPSPGLDTAAIFIAEEFKNDGLKPINSSYFQRVKMGKIKLGSNNHLAATINDKKINYKIKTDFTPFEMTGNKEVNAPVVFVGYGIDAPKFNYNDYAGIDVKGKVVFVLRHEPEEDNPESIFDGKKATHYSSVDKKVEIAIEKGAVGVMVIQDPLNHSMLNPRGFPWPSLSKLIPEDALPLSLDFNEREKIPVVQVGADVAADLFGSVEKLKEIQSSIDKDLKPASFEFKNVLISLKTETEFLDQSAKNVVGLLEGSDPELKEEVLVIGAHYDHVGVMKKHRDDEDYIFNGADDNASGTSCLLSVAAALSKMDTKPKRSILFIAFCGEEKGLFGSKYYVENPLIPLENTVAMLNLDMTGRNSIDSLFIEAADVSPELKEINEKENEAVGFTLLYSSNIGSGRSDHANFIKKGIPALFYFSGMHPDYHKVSDNPDKINYPKAVKVAKLVLRTAWQIANDNKKYSLIKK
ncbi:MAG: M20/M25/M40 family metallo-hydrolase [Ignavibacteriaceae bacterium]|nr:M20/M25/M40 family metallo-hydrolase [Ignavibacteriaceae bacterium]